MTIEVTCPACDGCGHQSDGAVSIGRSFMEVIKEPSQCPLCQGSGWVSISPATKPEMTSKPLVTQKPTAP
jgi:predicted Zn-ribbon and HTH transcriptional regulator